MNEWLRIFWLPSTTVERLKELPATAGVYYITALWIVLYVGKAKNLRNRWRTDHHRYQQFKLLHPFGRLHYRVLALNQIGSYEKSQIARFQPAWNGTARATFWNLLCLFLAIWMRVLVYAALLIGIISIVIYLFFSAKR